MALVETKIQTREESQHSYRESQRTYNYKIGEVPQSDDIDINIFNHIERTYKTLWNATKDWDTVVKYLNPSWEEITPFVKNILKQLDCENDISSTDACALVCTNLGICRDHFAFDQA
jgi:hypothetical protein